MDTWVDGSLRGNIDSAWHLGRCVELIVTLMVIVVVEAEHVKTVACFRNGCLRSRRSQRKRLGRCLLSNLKGFIALVNIPLYLRAFVFSKQDQSGCLHDTLYN